MRKILGWAACALVVVAAVAFGQAQVGTQGVVSGHDTHVFQNTPGEQTAAFFYTFPYVANASGANLGYLIEQSTAGNFTVNSAYAPLLGLSGATAGRRAQVMLEPGFLANAPTLPNEFRDSEFRVAFSLSVINSISGANAMFRVCVGDSTAYELTKKPEGFGVLYAGAAYAGKAADLATDCYVAFVGNGTDTTYVPIGTGTGGATPTDKIYIHANPNGGAVDFYVNNVLKASIASPVRQHDQGLNAGLVIEASGATGDIFCGPFAIERPW